MRWIGLLGFSFVVGCVKLNAAYLETDGGTSAADSTGRTDRPTGPDASASDSNSTAPGATTDSPGSTTEHHDTGDASDTTDGPLFDLGEEPVCTLEPDEPCDSAFQDCKSNTDTCAPWDPEQDGSIEATYCFPYGLEAQGDPCDPRCKGKTEATCGWGLVCDVYTVSDPTCRPTCNGAKDSACTQGICFTEEVETGEPLMICRGECNPTNVKACGAMETCVLDEEGIPYCSGVDMPVDPGGDCSDNPCSDGFVCVSADDAKSCSTAECCVPACNPATPMCPKGGMARERTLSTPVTGVTSSRCRTTTCA